MVRVLVEMWWILEFLNFVIDTVGKQFYPKCLNFMWRHLVPKQRTREHLDCIPPVAHCVCVAADHDNFKWAKPTATALPTCKFTIISDVSRAPQQWV